MTTSRPARCRRLCGTERYPGSDLRCAVAYYDSYRAAVLPANLIQASVTISVRILISALIKMVCSN